MPEIQEVFRMATQKVRPDPGALERQHGRERLHVLRQKVAVYGLVAALVIAAVVAVAILPDRAGTKTPNSKPSGAVAPQALERAEIIGLDGSLVGIVPGIPSGSCCLSLSPDGSRIAFDWPSGIATIRMDGTGLHELDLPFMGPDVRRTPVWSPDGTRLAVVGVTPATNTRPPNVDIYVVDADGSEFHRLTRSPFEDEWPTWSPDGSTIVYDNTGSQELDDSGFSPTQELYSIPATGGSRTRLTNNHVDDSQAAYSPDGSQIAFHRTDGAWIMDADGSDQRRLPLPGDCCTGFTPRWSPDGSVIAFTRYDGHWILNSEVLVRVFVFDVASGQVSPVGDVKMVTDLNTPQWLSSGDGLLIYGLKPVS